MHRLFSCYSPAEGLKFALKSKHHCPESSGTQALPLLFAPGLCLAALVPTQEVGLCRCPSHGLCSQHAAGAQLAPSEAWEPLGTAVGENVGKAAEVQLQGGG